MNLEQYFFLFDSKSVYNNTISAMFWHYSNIAKVSRRYQTTIGIKKNILLKLGTLLFNCKTLGL